MGIPKITYVKEMCFQFDSEPVRLEWHGSAHTSGDTIVIFEKSKVIHTGDLFFNGSAAYIDVKDGSQTQNWIHIIRKIARKYPDFIVIPGHGPVSDMKGWLEFADYLQFIRDQVIAAIKAGKTREQAMESIDLERYKHLKEKGNFITKKNNIGWIYDELTRK
jgi:glyoxylase-like metal-dependent hydrolase (beta-lactamase superfamily II)